VVEDRRPGEVRLGVVGLEDDVFAARHVCCCENGGKVDGSMEE
jgi:hypothetical protein